MKAIAAMCENRVIGFQGQIPWKKSLDMRFFKAMRGVIEIDNKFNAKLTIPYQKKTKRKND